MADESNIGPLDYRGPTPRPRQAPVASDEAARWRLRRIVFRVGVVAVLLPVTFYFGPNLIIFRKLTRPSPADYVPIVESQCIPTVRAIKEYQRDVGHLPEKLEDLVPKYLATLSEWQEINDGIFTQTTFYQGWHKITYDFNAGTEGWQVRGQFADGPIPAPPVTTGPATAPIASPK